MGYKKNNEDRELNDFYATPPEEVMNILKYEKPIGTILEPCCGMGHMVEGIVLSMGKDNYNVKATDLIDYGFGETGYDYLKEDYPYIENIGTIIMNPPFKHIEEFVVKSLNIAKYKIILFARTQFVESQSRYENIFKDNPPNKIYQYVDRVECAKDGNFNKYKGSNMAFAWFIWDLTENSNDTIFKWIRRYNKY